MRKTYKGALASAAAATLLAGTAGTLAFWTDSGDAEAGEVGTGELALGDATCDAAWTYPAGHLDAGDPAVRLVPGDVVTKSCAFELAAEGDHLRAELTAPSSLGYSEPGTTATTDRLDVEVAYALGGVALADGAVLTDADDGKTLTATFTVTMPYGTDQNGVPVVNGNDTQGWTALLDTLTVSVRQLAH
ncbi:hypothetical protein GCM10023340_34610 [Nocardioides marinquilinus]|uniref:Alternate-type signal peptide domain-containing protein n=1 Tax=Nocardioides marinquilinus TaxID=1210400 RepID=A0ABP9PYF3_9ACTN